ncbi:MAG TPA: hypothetical protein VF575_05050 [Candidatus Saccharimonadales bacterium]
MGNISFATGDPTTPSVFNKPYVAYTETAEASRRQGLGVQRARIMNNLSMAHFGHELHSDPSGDTSEEAHGLWLKLVSNGEAEPFDDDGLTRYRFKDPTTL